MVKGGKVVLRRAVPPEKKDAIVREGEKE